MVFNIETKSKLLSNCDVFGIFFGNIELDILIGYFSI